MSEDIWSHVTRHLQSERDKIAAELVRIDAELEMLPKIRLHLGLGNVTSAQVERWLAKYAQPAKSQREKLPRLTTEEARRRSSDTHKKRHLHEYQGEKRTLRAWAVAKGMNRQTLTLRLKTMTLAEAFEKPVGKQGKMKS